MILPILNDVILPILNDVILPIYSMMLAKCACRKYDLQYHWLAGLCALHIKLERHRPLSLCSIMSIMSICHSFNFTGYLATQLANDLYDVYTNMHGAILVAGWSHLSNKVCNVGLILLMEKSKQLKLSK